MIRSEGLRDSRPFTSSMAVFKALLPASYVTRETGVMYDSLSSYIFIVLSPAKALRCSYSGNLKADDETSTSTRAASFKPPLSHFYPHPSLLPKGEGDKRKT